jgi:putative membrane protein
MSIDRVDADRIAMAIAEAEKKTSAEIVVVIGRAASGYRLVPIVWAGFIALALPGLLLVIFAMTAKRLYEVELIVFAVAACVLSLGRYRYGLVPGMVKRHRAHETAREQFLARRISRTRDRTGILLYVALAERYAELVPDAGISDVIDDAAWKPAIERLLADVRQGRIADGVIGAVETAAALLAGKFPPAGDSGDELPNQVILL